MKKIYILMIAVLLGGVAKGQISLLPNLSPSDSGFTDNPVVYNNNLYFQYITDSEKSHLAKYDGSNITLIPNMNTNDVGISGKAVEYNGLLYMIYINDNGKKYLAEYNGNNLTIKPNINISDYGIEGNPFIYNGNLYFPYKNASEKIQLAKYSGTTISLVNNLNNNDYGCIWSPMIYNNKLFFGYKDTANHRFLINYDGTNLNIIPSPDTAFFWFVKNATIYNNKLYYIFDKYENDVLTQPGYGYYPDLVEYNDTLSKFITSTSYKFKDFFTYKNELIISSYEFAMQNYWNICMKKYDGNNIFDIDCPSSYSYRGFYGYPTINNDTLFFIYSISDNFSLAKYDGNSFNFANTESLPPCGGGGIEAPLCEFNNSLFFSYKIHLDTIDSIYLAKYDSGNISLYPITGFSENSYIKSFFKFNSNLYLIFKNNDNKFQLAKYNNSSGINETTPKQLNLYPNPATNTLTLNLSQQQGLQNATVSIYDIQGKQLLQQSITEAQTQIDISSFAKGIYIVKLQTEKETLQSKFIKE